MSRAQPLNANAERDSNSAVLKMSFCKEMRKATREIHDISDHLINMKLGIGKCFVQLSLTSDKIQLSLALFPHT